MQKVDFSLAVSKGRRPAKTIPSVVAQHLSLITVAKSLPRSPWERNGEHGSDSNEILHQNHLWNTSDGKEKTISRDKVIICLTVEQ